MEWMRMVTIGRYLPGDSPLHRADPGVKVLLAICILWACFAVSDLQSLMVYAALLVWAAGVAKIPLGFVLSGLRPMAWVIALVMGAYLAAGGGHEVVWRIGAWEITREALTSALCAGLRLALAVWVLSLLTLTTSPVAMTDAIEGMLRPLAWCKVPTWELSAVATLALRFVPTLAQDGERIAKAQTSRGASFLEGSWVARIVGLLPLLIPLTAQAFRHAEQLALAMEVRGYRGGEGRTHLHPRTIRWRDAALAALVGAVLAAGAWLPSVGP